MMKRTRRKPVSPPRVTTPIPTRRQVSAARFAVFFTLIAWVGYVFDQVRRLRAIELSLRTLLETLMYAGLVTALAVSAVAYLIARLGHLYRRRDHRPTPRALIDADLGEHPPSMTVLVPSYREDSRIIRQTLISAALQEYRGIDVVLLVDDPPNPTDSHQLELLSAAHRTVDELRELLAEPARAASEAVAAFGRRRDDTGPVDGPTLHTLADSFADSAAWLRRTADDITEYADADHSDAFIRRHVFGDLIDDLDRTASALREAAADSHAYVSQARAHQLIRRLDAIFNARFFVFERKRFASLSHEANKAMNLNSYIGLMGGHFSVQTSPGGSVLVPCRPESADLSIADPDYVLTLDADSVLLPEYCLRLVHAMEQPENGDVAVMQTPYSAYPGATSRIERIAGATTDVQHIVHQGLTHYGATFWVGANAVLRKRAIDALAVDDFERGFPVKRYVADRTVIEDTESSIDLRALGWQLANYPERLSYSATPPDYGSLVVQRKRWANGGLVILPKLLRWWRRPNESIDRPSLLELLLRVNYLSSIMWSSLGLLVLLMYPFDDRALSLYAVATAVPYFLSMSTDLRRSGYRRLDIARLYGFNLLLLPVNLAGAASSIVQAIGGQKVDFARTPKVGGRTAAPMSFVIAPLVMLAWSGYSLARDVHHDLFARATFAGLNAITLTYALLAFVGLRYAVVDIVLGLREHAYTDRRPEPTTAPAPHWSSVLYVGASGDADDTSALAAALAANDQSAAFAADERQHLTTELV